MVLQAEVTTKRMEDTAAKQFQDKNNWSDLPTAEHLVTTAESILGQQVKRYKAGQYVVRRIQDKAFEVMLVVNEEEEHEDGLGSEMGGMEEQEEEQQQQDGTTTSTTSWSSWTRPPIPRFQRVRLVNCSNDSRFCCSCFQFERIGIPCVHIYAVVKEIDPSWEGFLLHHHVAVWWWSVFVCHGFGDEETEGNRNRRSCHRISKEGHCVTAPFIDMEVSSFQEHKASFDNLASVHNGGQCCTKEKAK